MRDRDEHISVLESIHHDHYSVEELAKLLGMSNAVIEHAAFTGELKAFVVDHHVLDILRSDVLIWMNETAVTSATVQKPTRK